MTIKGANQHENTYLVRYTQHSSDVNNVLTESCGSFTKGANPQ